MQDYNCIISEVKRALQIEASSIDKLCQQIDKDVVFKIVETIGNCTGKVVLSGCGTSAMAAKKISHSMNCIERPSVFISPSDAVHGGLGCVQKDDVLILISKGGNTSELIGVAEAGVKKNAIVIVVTENGNGVLVKYAGIVLLIKVDREPCKFNMLATASTLAVISVFDAICIALMEYTDYTKEQFSIIHPGGAVGDRLLGRKDCK